MRRRAVFRMSRPSLRTGSRRRRRVSSRRRVRSTVNRIPRAQPRLHNLQSKLVAFRQRVRFVISGDNSQIEGGALVINPTFAQLNATEYARGREEVVQFMRVNFAGLAVYVKKTADKAQTLVRDGTTTPIQLRAVSETNSSSRTSWVHNLYVTAAQINNNNVTIDTVAGATRNIRRRGKKAYHYRVPRTIAAGHGLDAGTTFGSSAPNWTWPQIVSAFTGETNINIPSAFWLVVDSWPAPTTISSSTYPSIITTHSTSVEMFIYYYFSCYGKRSNV